MNNPIIKLPVAELKTAIGGLTKVVTRHITLPVLGAIHIERDPQGWVHLTGTDLDSFLSLRLETPAQIGSPTKCLVPFAELQKLGKSCPADEVLDLEVLSEDKLLLRHRIGSHPVEQVITSVPVTDFPEVPSITASSVSLDEAARATLLNALACASDDETRVILNGAYLDVSKPSGHYAVATDGRHLFEVKFTPVRVVCQNTLSLAINQGGAGIKISHHTDIHQRMKAAEKMLGIVRHQFDELADTFREMVQVPMNGNRLEKYLEYVYPEPKDRLPTESEAECIARDRSWSEYFFDQGAGNRLKGVEGTLWAAYNGVTEWLDHRKIRQSADQRLASIWFGEANRVKARALTVAVEMLPHFRN